MSKLTAILLAVVCFLVPSLSCSQEQNPDGLCDKSYALCSQGDSGLAEELLLRTLERNFILEDYSLHYLALIAVKSANLTAARQYYSQLRLKFPDSVWLAQADLQLAKLALAERNYARAAELARGLPGQRARREIAEEAGYLLGQALEGAGDSKQAYAAYQELRRAAALSTWDVSARNAVAALREKSPELFGAAAPEAVLDEADLLTREQAYPDAEKLYLKLLEQTPQGGFRPRVLAALGNHYRVRRKPDEVVAVLAEIVQSYPDSAEAPAALNQLAQIYWNRDDDAKALEYFKQLRDRYPKSSFVDFAENASARIYESLGRQDDALAAYQSLAKRGTDGQMREEAAWRAAGLSPGAGAGAGRAVAPPAGRGRARRGQKPGRGRRAPPLAHARVRAQRRLRPHRRARESIPVAPRRRRSRALPLPAGLLGKRAEASEGKRARSLSGRLAHAPGEPIPYTETQLYVKLVLRNLRVYKKIYGEQK